MWKVFPSESRAKGQWYKINPLGSQEMQKNCQVLFIYLLVSNENISPSSLLMCGE